MSFLHQNNLICLTRTGTGNSIAFVPTGTKVAVTGFSYKAVLLGATLMVIEDGAGTNRWVAEIGATGQISGSFDHPLILDGLGVVLSGGTSPSWSVSYAEV